LRACCYKELSQGGTIPDLVTACMDDCTKLMNDGGENPDVETLDLLGRL